MSLTVQTERLQLRPWTLEDVEAAYAIYRDPEVMRFLGGTSQTWDEVRERLQQYITHQERHGFSMWAAVELATGHVVGRCGLKYLDGGPEVEVGYDLARAVWNRGYATEGAGASLRYGFERLRLPRIVGVVNPANYASQRVLQKIGLVYERMGFYYGYDLQVYAATAPAGVSSADQFGFRKPVGGGNGDSQIGYMAQGDRPWRIGTSKTDR